MYNSIRTFLACIVVLVSVCCAAEKYASVSPDKLFKARTGVTIVHSFNETEFVALGFLPPESTKEQNYVGYYTSHSEFDEDDDDDASPFSVYAYCACKRKEGLYDFYYMLMPAAEDSHVFHALLKFNKQDVNLKKKHKGEYVETEYSPYAMDAELLKNARIIVDADKGKHADHTMKRLRTISVAHAQGGNKKVREVLKGKLSDNFQDICAEDMEKKEDAEDNADETPAPAPAPKAQGAPKKDLPITVQNNMSDKIRVGKKIASVVKQGYGHTTVSWLLEITNTSSETLDFFSINHHVLNDAELEMDSSMENVENMKPGETRKVKGSIMVEDAVWAKAASHEFTIES